MLKHLGVSLLRSVIKGLPKTHFDGHRNKQVKGQDIWVVVEERGWALCIKTGPYMSSMAQYLQKCLNSPTCVVEVESTH